MPHFGVKDHSVDAKSSFNGILRTTSPFDVKMLPLLIHSLQRNLSKFATHWGIQMPALAEKEGLCMKTNTLRIYGH